MYQNKHKKKIEDNFRSFGWCQWFNSWYITILNWSWENLGVPIARGTSFLAVVATLITNGNFWTLKLSF